MVRTWVLVVLVVLSSAAIAGPGDLQGPEAEHGDLQAKIALPALPAFEIQVAPVGTVGVRELLVTGRPRLNTDVKVSGYVTWIYDCLSAVRRPGQSAAKAQKMIDDDPTQCERAKLYLGDSKTTPPEQALWVVDLPRAYNKLEVERIPKADRTLADRCEPDKKRKSNLCVNVAVGDYVVVSGKFALSSPHSERNSDGLIVFAAVAAGTPLTTTTTKAVVPAPARALAPLKPKAKVQVPPSETSRKSSLAHSNDGTRAYGMKDYPTAVGEYRAALKDWDGNHVAWYGLAGAQIGQADWQGAVTSIAKAFELLPTNAMYAMVLGYTTYELTIANQRAAPTDLATLDFSRAEQILRYALTLDAKLWRANYYLGRILRDSGRAKDAAAAFTSALAGAPMQPGPWIALTELYRRWQYTDQAIAIADQGTQRVAGPESTDVWYVLGMALDDKRVDAKAIEAFTKAIEADPNNVKARFQRGQVYARTKGKKKEAKADLEAFLAAAPDSLGFAKQQANRLLMDLAAKR